jgi:MoaA/NifB/PqqE/SkfB family radical SAM enzyme
MYVYELVLEITRRCNIQCAHCLRGPAQSMNMSKETMEKALEGVTHIGTVTFSGGEPSLNVPLIRHFTQYVRDWHIEVDYFYVITNGKIASTSMKEALLELSNWVNDPESCFLTMSRDQYHRELGYDQYRAMDLYEDLPFFSADARKVNIEMPINEGNAFWNGIGMRDAVLNNPILTRDEMTDAVECIEGTIYVNAKGDVIPACDFSYESQELEKIGNVHDKTIQEILEAHVATLEKVEEVA